MNRHHLINNLSAYFASQDGQLLLGNMSLTQLAQRVGKTPFYAYDRQAITRRVAQLRQHLPSDVKLHYAIKANPMAAVVQHLATLVDGFDLASAGEMKLALDTVMPAECISFAGPGKQLSEIQQAIAAGVTLNVESATELEKIAAQAGSMGINANVAVRINPAFELKSSGMKMAGGAKPFGIDEEQLPQILQRIKQLGLAFQGFHIFSGSQCLNAPAIIECQQQSLQLAAKLAELCSSPVHKLNIGGGFGIPYFPGDMPLALPQIGEALTTALQSFHQQLPQTQVILELGRYLVGEAGIYVTRIVDKKTSRGQVFLVTDGGLNHHLAASGNFGQVIRKNYPVCIGNKIDPQSMETVTIVGPLCTPLDILADKVSLPIAEPGDLVVVFQSGAYGYTASPHGFLSQAEAVEVLV